jgi:DNA-binding LacI/PurR family transcriptional regulator
MPFLDDYIVDSPYNIEGGYEAMNKFFQDGIPLPTAIIAINDFTAIGIMQAIKEHGMSIPEDISLASFDNTYIAESSLPRLTSVGYDYQQFGKTLISSAISMIQGQEVARIQLIKSELVIRESCKKIN